jgi:hypothetical protein
MTDRLFFLLVIVYLPFSMLFIFWLYLASIIFSPDSWQYQLFYGRHGNIALVWLLTVLLPAFLFLILKLNRKKFVVSILGASGFYCLLASLVSMHGYLALPGFVLIIMSAVINRRLKKEQNQK